MDTKDTTAWSTALTRGTALAQLSVPGDEQCWDRVATAGILAIALYAVAHRDTTAVEEVPLGRLILGVDTQEQFTALAREELTAAGHNLDVVDPHDPVAVRWQWLHRAWDPDASPGVRWDGLSRGIARGLPDPAVHVCLGWVHTAGDIALLAERGGLTRRSMVLIHAGDYAGQRGRVEAGAWRITDTGTAVQPGPPNAYLIGLGAEQGFRAVRVSHDKLSVVT